MTVIVTVVDDGSGACQALTVPVDAFLEMVQDHRAGCLRRRVLVDPAIDRIARLAVNGGQRRPTGTDIGGSLDPAGGPRDADAVPSGRRSPVPTQESPSMAITYAEAAEELCVSKSTIKRRVKAGTLSRVGTGSGARITRESIDAYIAQGGTIA